MKKTNYIRIQIGNDISELGEHTYYLSFDEMHNRFPCLAKEIEEARAYANAENLNVEELYDSKEEAEKSEEDYYDGSSKIDLINSDEKFQ